MSSVTIIDISLFQVQTYKKEQSLSSLKLRFINIYISCNFTTSRNYENMPTLTMKKITNHYYNTEEK